MCNSTRAMCYQTWPGSDQIWTSTSPRQQTNHRPDSFFDIIIESASPVMTKKHIESNKESTTIVQIWASLSRPWEHEINYIHTSLHWRASCVSKLTPIFNTRLCWTKSAAPEHIQYCTAFAKTLFVPSLSPIILFGHPKEVRSWSGFNIKGVAQRRQLFL